MYTVPVSVVFRSPEFPDGTLRYQLHVPRPSLAAVRERVDGFIRDIPGAILVGLDDVYRVSARLRVGAMLGRETVYEVGRAALRQELSENPAAAPRRGDDYCLVAAAYLVSAPDGSYGILVDMLESTKGGRRAIVERAARRARTAAFRAAVTAANALDEEPSALEFVAVRQFGRLDRNALEAGIFLKERSGRRVRPRLLTADEVQRSIRSAQRANRQGTRQ